MTRRATPWRPTPRASNAGRQALVGSALYCGYESLGRAARLLPRPQAYAAARMMMQAVWFGWPAGRAAAIENASVLLPHVDWRGDAASLGRAQFRRYGEYLVDAVRLDELTPQACFAAVDGAVEDWRRLRERYGSRPTLFALMHMGNWDALGGAYTHACGRSQVLVDPLGHPQLDAAVQGPRDRLGMTPAAGAPGLRRVIEALRGGGTAAVLFDRPPAAGDRGVAVRLFGREARVSSTLERIARASDATVVPLAAVRVREGAFRFRALIELDAGIEGAGEQVTQRTIERFEPWLAAHPDQWYQFGRFFGTAEDGALDHRDHGDGDREAGQH